MTMVSCTAIVVAAARNTCFFYCSPSKYGSTKTQKGEDCVL